MRALVHVALATALLARIVHGDLAQTPLHEHDEIGDAEHQHDDQQDRQAADVAVANLFQRADRRRRQAGDDTGEDDQRDAVADAALGDLLAEPHQEHGAGGQRDDRGQHEADALVVGHALLLQGGRDTEALHHGQEHGAHARILGQLAPTALALIAHRLPRTVDLAHQLHDDRGGDIRHHVQREQAEAMQGATGEHVEHVHDGALLAVHQFQHLLRIDARHRYVAADAVDDQRQQHEGQALTQFGELAEPTQGVDGVAGLRQGLTPSRCRRRLRWRPWRRPSRARP